MKTIPMLIHNPFEIKKPLTWLSTLERNFCGSFYNHGALLVFDDLDLFGLGKDIWVVVEAVSVGVHVITYEHYSSYSTNRIIGTFDIDQEKLDYTFLKSTIGRLYQYSAWWSQVCMRISESLIGDSRLTRFFSNYNNPNRFYCFELQNEFLKSGFGYACSGKDFEMKYDVKLFTSDMMVI
jgi:hypothetical protein